jgi:hypothetical protein
MLMAQESRFQLTDQHDHACYQALVDRARHQIGKRIALYQELATPHRAGAVSAPLSGRGGSDDRPQEGSRRH